jgi:hypothetical protein
MLSVKLEVVNFWPSPSLDDKFADDDDEIDEAFTWFGLAPLAWPSFSSMAAAPPMVGVRDGTVDDAIVTDVDEARPDLASTFESLASAPGSWGWPSGPAFADFDDLVLSCDLVELEILLEFLLCLSLSLTLPDDEEDDDELLFFVLSAIADVAELLFDVMIDEEMFWLLM